MVKPERIRYGLVGVPQEAALRAGYERTGRPTCPGSGRTQGGKKRRQGKKIRGSSALNGKNNCIQPPQKKIRPEYVLKGIKNSITIKSKKMPCNT